MTPGRRGRFVVEAAIGALLVLVAVVALVAGGSLSVTTTGSASAAQPSAAAPALILQCPLGVHRVSLPRR